MSDDRVILLTNRGDGVDEVPNDEEDYEAAGIELNVNIPFAAYNKPVLGIEMSGIEHINREL